MKKFLKKIRPYSFWLALASAVVVLLNAFGKFFGFTIENQVVEDAILSVAGLLAVFGIVNINVSKDQQNEDKPNLSDEENSNDINSQQSVQSADDETGDADKEENNVNK